MFTVPLGWRSCLKKTSLAFCEVCSCSRGETRLVNILQLGDCDTSTDLQRQFVHIAASRSIFLTVPVAVGVLSLEDPFLHRNCYECPQEGQQSQRFYSRIRPFLQDGFNIVHSIGQTTQVDPRHGMAKSRYMGPLIVLRVRCMKKRCGCRINQFEDRLVRQLTR